MKKQKLLLLLVMTMVAMAAISANAYVLVYEPFDYPDAALNGQGGAIGTTGTWTTYDKGFAEGWWCHPGGELSGVFVSATAPNIFDGTVANLPTAGGFVGMAGPEDRGLAAGTDAGTGNLDASIALDPSVTATFTSGTTTWFSYVGAHAWDRNQGAPTLMICTDPTTNGSRGLTMQNSGNGIGGVGGPPRSNLSDVYPHYFKDGVHNQTPGGYLDGVFGGHDGIVTGFCSTGTCDGVLDESGQPRTQTMAWQVSDDDGFGAANIIVGKIEWDADTNGEDVITIVSFLEDEEINEAAFDALVADLPALSSANWASNKPDLDQSQFDTLNISGLKFFVDELRIGTTFDDIIGLGKPKMNPSPANKSIVMPGDIELSWENLEQDPTDTNDLTVVVWFGTDPNKTEGDMAPLVLDPVSGLEVTSVIREGLTDGTYYWQVNTTFGTDPCVIDGPMWEFYVISDLPPSVVIETGDQMTWSGEPVTLVATVTNDDESATIIEWVADPDDEVDIADGDTATPTVTITKTPYSEAKIVNAGFEHPVLDDGTDNGTTPTGWTKTGSSGMADAALGALIDTVSEGEQCVWANVGGIFSTVLSETVQAGATYTLSVDIGHGKWSNSNTKYLVQLIAVDGGNEVVLAEDYNSITVAPQAWVTSEISYTNDPVADANKIDLPLMIKLINPADSSSDVEFDNVVLTSDPLFPISTGVDTVTLTVLVSDGANPIPVEASVEIDVYDSACLMARFGEGKAADNLGDLNGDCDTNLEDLALIAEKWLNDIRLGTPQHK